MVRTAIEVSCGYFGLVVGGVAGVGTLLFAFGIGPSISMSMYVFSNYVFLTRPQPVS